MSVQRRANGSWRARIRGLDGKETSRHFPKRNQAVAWEAEQKAALARGTWVDESNKLTFIAFYEDWSQRQVWESGTLRNITIVARKTTFANYPLVKIKRAHIEVWIKHMQTSGLAASTVKTRLVNVRSTFKAAVRERIISTDPTAGVVLPRQRRREAAITLPAVEDVRAVLNAADDHLRAFVAVAAFAGLRWGEVSGLQVNDIDFTERVISVERQVQRAGTNSLEVRRPKYGSERLVSMADGLACMLRAHINRYGMTGDQWLFPGLRRGVPIQHSSFSYFWRKACGAAGVNLRFHDLRHYFASSLIHAGCDVVQVQRALGHASATTTLSTYAHYFRSGEERVRDAAQGMIDRTCGLSADRDLGEVA